MESKEELEKQIEEQTRVVVDIVTKHQKELKKLRKLQQYLEDKYGS